MSKPNFKLNSSTPRKRGWRKYIILVSLAIFIGLAGYLFIQKSSNYTRKAELKLQNEAQITSSKQSDSADNSSKNPPAKSTTTTTDKVPTSDSISVRIDTASQTNGRVEASAYISDAKSDGTCVFTYSNPDDKPVIQQVASINGLCSSNVPEVQFSKLGVWKLSVVFYLNDVKAEANQNVTIN